MTNEEKILSEIAEVKVRLAKIEENLNRYLDLLDYLPSQPTGRGRKIKPEPLGGERLKD